MRQSLFLSLALACGASEALAQCPSVVKAPAYSYGSAGRHVVSYGATRRGVSYGDVVVEKVVVKEVLTPVAVPVLVPATVFQYVPALAPPAAVAAAPVQQGGVPVQQPGAPTQQAPQPLQAAPSAPDIDRIVRERVEAILREKFGAAGSPPPLTITGELPQQPWSPPQPQAPQTAQQPQQAQPANDQALTQSVANLLAAKCASCHTAGVKTSGGVTLFTRQGDQTLFSPSVTKAAILASVTAPPGGVPSMPPTAKSNPAAAVRGEELALVQQWASRP